MGLKKQNQSEVVCSAEVVCREETMKTSQVAVVAVVVAVVVVFHSGSTEGFSITSLPSARMKNLHSNSRLLGKLWLSPERRACGEMCDQSRACVRACKRVVTMYRRE